MGMTMGEKILAQASGESYVEPGQIVITGVDMCMSNDGTTHITVDMFENEIKHQQIFDHKKVIFIGDHNVPSESVKTSETQRKMREFARRHEITYYEGQGICHQIMIENHVEPGQVIVGADSHTCSYGALGAFGIGIGCTDFVATMTTGTVWLVVPETIKINLKGKLKKGVYARDLILKIIGDIGADGATYKILEFGGEGASHLTIDDRIVLCNMAVEAGAKTALFEVDDTTINYMKAQGRSIGGQFKSDEDAKFSQVLSYDLSQIKPMLAKPHFVDNVGLVSECEGIKLDQCFIGSCNNGRIEELRVAANILKGKKVKEGLKLIIAPASNNVYLQAIEEGVIQTLIESGAIIVNSNCSVCWGACQGVLGKGEVMLSTGTRNFKGRAGDPESYIYLASAATVAASAIAGEIKENR